MFPKINPTSTKAWKELQLHFEEMKDVHMKNLFAKDINRFDTYSIKTDQLLFDFSKNIITEKTLQLLQQLAVECNLPEAIEAMFAGEKINDSEKRSVLHTALRNFSNTPVLFEGNDVMPEVKLVLDQMKNFCQKIHSGEWKGYSGKKIKYIVNIGINGYRSIKTLLGSRHTNIFCKQCRWFAYCRNLKASKC